VAVAKLGIVATVVAASLWAGASATYRFGGNNGNGGVALGAQPSGPSISEAAYRRCNRYAAPWGSKHGNGSRAHPVHGPYKLVRILRAGQTGCLRSGTYHQTQTTVRRRGVTIQSAPGERATLLGRIVLQGRGDRVIGMHLNGRYGPRCGSSACGTLPSPTINAPDVVIALNDITSPDSGICVHPRAWHGQEPNRFRILANRIHDCGRRPHTDHDHGIYVADGNGGEIADNVVYDNADRGIQLYPNAHDTLVLRNTVDGNGSGVVYSEGSSGNQVRDNVFTNSVVRWNAETFNLYGYGNVFAGNCVRAGNRNRQYNQNGGVELPRMVAQRGNHRARKDVYVSRRAGDFRVRRGSPCAGKGAPDWIAAH
jgi:parallel beta-helix repeat protein